MPSDNNALSGTTPVQLSATSQQCWSNLKITTEPGDDIVMFGDSSSVQKREILPGVEFSVDAAEYGGVIDLSALYVRCKNSGGAATVSWFYPS